MDYTEDFNYYEDFNSFGPHHASTPYIETAPTRRAKRRLSFNNKENETQEKQRRDNSDTGDVAVNQAIIVREVRGRIALPWVPCWLLLLLFLVLRVLQGQQRVANNLQLPHTDRQERTNAVPSTATNWVPDLQRWWGRCTHNWELPTNESPARSAATWTTQLTRKSSSPRSRMGQQAAAATKPARSPTKPEKSCSRTKPGRGEKRATKADAPGVLR